MKKILIAIALALISSISFGASSEKAATPDRLDKIKQAGQDRYCQFIGLNEKLGAFWRWQGAPLQFKNIPNDVAQEFLEHDALPQEKYVWIIDMDQMTPHEIEGIEEPLTQGWKDMDKALKADPKMKEPDWEKLTIDYYGTCMGRKDI